MMILDNRYFHPSTFRASLEYRVCNLESAVISYFETLRRLSEEGLDDHDAFEQWTKILAYNLITSE